MSGVLSNGPVNSDTGRDAGEDLSRDIDSLVISLYLLKEDPTDIQNWEKENLREILDRIVNTGATHGERLRPFERAVIQSFEEGMLEGDPAVIYGK